MIHTTDEKRALVHRATAMGITLDGAPAAIGGYALDFAGVRRLDGKGGRVEYSWRGVQSVLDTKGGKFQS